MTIYDKLDDLKYIKKDYGENMSHLCRETFSSILETPGLLYHVLTTHFNKSRDLYDDIIKENKVFEFKEYIYNFVDNNSYDDEEVKSVTELLDSVGYELYECKTHEDILKFKKYYSSGEELCTFNDPNRIKNHHIFFIVRKNVDDIKRKDYLKPDRQDEYSTSVLDLQFDRGNTQRVSIKSRYNHSVKNPDATHSNNLENIVPGLTRAFECEYNFNIFGQYKTSFELDHYIQTRDFKNYKYNCEIRNVHYCPDNIIIDDGVVIDTYKDKGRYTLIDYFILDNKEKRLFLYDKHIEDSFIDEFKDINKINITNKEYGRLIEIKYDVNKTAIIKIDKNNRIIGYKNHNILNLGNGFLRENNCLEELNLPNLISCNHSFLIHNKCLKNLNLPKLESCEDLFLEYNNSIENLELPSLISVGNQFLSVNNRLVKIDLPNLSTCGDDFLSYNNTLKELKLLNLKSCGRDFLQHNNVLNKIELPKLKTCRSNFLRDNQELNEIDLPKLESCFEGFLAQNQKIDSVYLPKLEYAFSDFLKCNQNIKVLYLPELKYCGASFLYSNNSIEELYLPNLEECAHSFLRYNKVLKKIYLPKLKDVGIYFMFGNNNLSEYNLSSLEKITSGFLGCNYYQKRAIVDLKRLKTFDEEKPLTLKKSLH